MRSARRSTATRRSPLGEQVKWFSQQPTTSRKVLQGIQKARALHSELAKTRRDLEEAQRQLEDVIDNHQCIHANSKELPTPSRANRRLVNMPDEPEPQSRRSSLSRPPSRKMSTTSSPPSPPNEPTSGRSREARLAVPTACCCMRSCRGSRSPCPSRSCAQRRLLTGAAGNGASDPDKHVYLVDDREIRSLPIRSRQVPYLGLFRTIACRPAVVN
jgi:hypothetical protein